MNSKDSDRDFLDHLFLSKRIFLFIQCSIRKLRVIMSRKIHLSHILILAIFLMTISAASAVDVSTAEGLQSAFTAGGDVKLTADVTGNFTIPSGSTVSLDLNGHNITMTEDNDAYVIRNQGILTVSDGVGTGSISTTLAGKGGIRTGNDANTAKTTLSGGNIKSTDYGIVAMNGSVTVTGGNISVSSGGLVFTGNGLAKYSAEFNISGGNFTAGDSTTSSDLDCGIYMPGNGNLTVTGGNFTIKNGAGIVARAGNTTISNVNITTGGTSTGTVGDSRVVVNSSAIVFDGAGGSAYPCLNDSSKISVSGGNFKSDANTIQTIDENERGRISLTGGTFSSNPADYVAEGYGTRQDSTSNLYVVDTTFTVTFDDTITVIANSENLASPATVVNGTELTLAFADNKTGIFTATVGEEDPEELEGSSYTVESDVTLDGIYTYTVSFDAEKLTVKDGETALENGAVVKDGTELTLAFAEEGKTGIFTATVGEEESVLEGTTYTVESDVTLGGVYQYEVTFDDTIITVTADNEALTSGAKVNASTDLTLAFAEEGKSGIFTATVDEEESVLEGTTYTVESDVTLGGVYQYAVTFDDTITVTAGETTLTSGDKVNASTEVTLAFADANKTGSFTYQTAEDEEPVSLGEATTYTVESDVTLGGVYKSEQITVTYDANGAEGTVPESVTLDAEDITSMEVADQGDLVNGELPFSGWNTEADGNGTAYSAGDTITYEDLEGNITLYAQWGEETEGNYTAEWTWEKVSKTNYKATATFTDENGTVVAENVKATVTSKTEGDITTYTATVNFEGTDYTDEKSFYNGGFGTPAPVVKVRAGTDLVKAMIEYLVNGTPLPEDYLFDLNEDETIDGRDLIELEKTVSENGYVYRIVS